MTTESAPVPHPARRLAVPPAPSAPSALHAPRGAGRRHGTAPGARPPSPGAARAGLLAADACAVALTLALVEPPSWPFAVLLPLVLAVPALHACRGLYRPALAPSALAEVPSVAALALLSWLVAAEALTAVDARFAVGWRALGLAVAAQTLLVCGARALVHALWRRAVARRPRPVLIVGRGTLARQITAVLQRHRGYGMRPVAQADPYGPYDADAQHGPHGPHGQLGPHGLRSEGPVPLVLTGRPDLARALGQHRVTDAVLTERPAPGPDGAALVAFLADHGCRLWLVDGGAADGDLWHRPDGPDQLWGFSVRPLRGTQHRPVARVVKRALDASVAAAALLAAAPVLGVCALAVRIADGPGVLFRQERIGLDGERFTLLKFRTLAPADPTESATRWNVAHDRRMSTTGRLLRRTSLDELPQLWNVLRGDMSLVGPRPERPYFVDRFIRTHPGYHARHRMPAGITGLAQVHGLRGDTSIEERARFDNHYIATWSPWGDVCILARTAACLLRREGS
ncbi:exopolysaccharide biosynthesis polyprenyl glycosylphosphotransferase [Streptomyces sp. NPDC057638]|uniref:exopolysaccharide biosynthesis polyprenyl glycosylphosphotransferase n=1 Tax=Streptomyces sp. NPDC057638 TaxID=3346190 RepID=UPI0036CBC974